MNIRVLGSLTIGLVALAGLHACKKADDNSTSGGRPNTARVSTAGEPQDPVNGAATAEGLSDSNIFFAFDAANVGDSVKGFLAATKGTSSEVRDFAKMMVRDHHALRQQGQDLSKRLAVQPTPPAGESLTEKLDAAVTKLTAAAKGRDFDKAYMDHEVAAHREVLTMVVAAMSSTQNSEIKNLIQKAAPIIQAHLDKAKAIQKNLQK